MLELALTRIFSVVFYYHFAFLAISIALFGLGVGGVFSYLVAGRTKSLFGTLGNLAALNSLCVGFSLWFVLSRRGELTIITLIPIYFASALPFFLGGIIVSLVIGEAIQRVDRAYFFDLVGAAAGCLLLIPLLTLLGGPNTVMAAAVLFAVSSATWYNVAGANKRRAAGVVLSLALVVFVVYNARVKVIDVRYAKERDLPSEMFSKWNSISRIGLSHDDNGGFMSIVIDNDASTGIPPYDWNSLTDTQRKNLFLQGPGIPYVLRPGAKTLIIGPGGGWDVARAFASGSRDITGVEINPIIANTIMRQKYADLSHRLYLRPEVHIVVEDGRSFVRRTPQKFGVIQATLVDTWASTAAGAFALSENNLYTSDAFRDYLSHLTDDGIMAFTRWGFEPPRESLRLISLAIGALEDLGEDRPARHVIVAREDAKKINAWGAQDTVIISRKPFSRNDLERVRIAMINARIDIVYLPGDKAKNPFGQLLLSPDPEQFRDDYDYDVSPVDDDRPFFFYTVQPRDLWTFLTQANETNADYKVNRAVPLLFGLLGVSVLATALIILLPRVLLGSRLPREKGILSFLFYFVFIGIGYILIQVALIQKFVLFLGHPTYALTVVIFSMLVASGLGSYWSRKVVGASDSRLLRVLGAVAATVVLLAFMTSPLTTAAVGLPLTLKIVITILLVFPAGFLMGIPFPTGLKRLETRHLASVRWAWSLNAASSVLGSVLAIFLAIYLGLRITLIVGGLCYLCSLGVFVATRTHKPTQAPVPVAS